MAHKSTYVQDDELTALLRMLTLDDLIAGVVAESELDVFASCTATVHGFFSSIKDEGNMPKPVQRVLGSAVFEVGDWFPFSPEVEGALLRLQIAGLLSADNPDYTALRMKPDARRKISRRLENQDEATRKFITKTGHRFAQQLNTQTMATG